jgi:hypothetical protein
MLDIHILLFLVSVEFLIHMTLIHKFTAPTTITTINLYYLSMFL